MMSAPASPGFSGYYLRKLLWIMILATVITVSIIILPRVPTPNPAVDSKLLALRALLAAVLALGVFNWKAISAPRWRFADTIFAGLTVSFVLSSLFSGRFLYCISQYWHLGGFYCLAWLIYRLRPSFMETAAVIRLGGLLGIIAALYGFLTFTGYDILRSLYPFDFEAGESGGRNYIHSFFGNPEYFGGFAAPTAVMLLGLGLQPQIAIWRRAGWIIASGFVLGVLALSGSRGAFLGFMAGAILIFLGQVGLLSKKMQKASWGISILAALALVAGLIVLSTPNPLNPRDMRLIQRFGDLVNTQSASVRERLLFYTSTALAIPANPVFGFGPGTYRLEFFENVKLLIEQDQRAGTTMLLKDLKRRLAEHTHNDFLEFWFEQGTVGFSLFMLMIAYGTVRYFRGRWIARSHTRIYQHFAAPVALHVTLFAAVMTFLINALTSFPFHMPARGTLAWVLIGSFFAVDYKIHEAMREPGSIERVDNTKDET